MTAAAMPAAHSVDEQALNRARGKFSLVTMGILFVIILTSAFLPATQWWKSAAFAVAVNLSLYGAWIAAHGDWALLRWAGVAIVAGYVELFADWWLVTLAGPAAEGLRIGNLIYGPMPKVWVSPAYMPLAWAGVILQLMALGVWLRDLWGTRRATIVVAVAGGIYIPLYEHLARSAEWWIYVRTPMVINNAPSYIVLGEALLCIPLIVAAVRVREANILRVLFWGVVVGLGIFVAYWIAFGLVGGCDPSYPFPSGTLHGLGTLTDLKHGCSVPPGIF